MLDMSLAATSYFGLVEAMTAERYIPEDMAYSVAGMSITSPAEAVKGAIRSFDRGFKGFALTMVGEILAGPLVGASYCGLGGSKGNWGHLIFAIDPNLLGDRDEFTANVAQIIAKVKSTK